MKRAVLKAFATATAFVVLLAPAAFGAEHDHNHGQHATPAVTGHENGTNPLIEEMRTLDKVFQEVVSAVALGDGERAHKALEAMHGKMEKTQEGVHKGEVQLRKNAGKVKEFVKMDKAFHKDLEALAVAAHHNDARQMNAVTKRLLDGCVSCHQQFRP